MTVAEMVSYIKLHGFTDLTDAEVLIPLNQAYHEVARKHPWNFLEFDKTLPTVPGQEYLTFDVGAPLRATIAVVNVTTGNPLYPLRTDAELKDNPSMFMPSATTGEPVWYTVGRQGLLGTPERTIRLQPVPNTVYQIRVRFLMRTVDLTLSSAAADILVPATFHEVIVLGALYRLYGLNDDTQQRGETKQLFEDMIQSMVEDDFKTNYDQPDTVYDIYQHEE